MPNGGFESDTAASSSPYYVAPPITDWSAINVDVIAPAPYAATYGEGLITPSDGVNVGYIYCAQPARYPYFTQTLASTYTAGDTYTLTVAAALYKAGTGNNALEIMLGTSPANPIAELTIANSDLAVGSFADFTVSTGPITGAAAGAPIVVWLGEAVAGTAGPSYYVNNVRLADSTPSVPEPCALALLASGLLGLAAYAWRKRK